jgi:hypothetical protein
MDVQPKPGSDTYLADLERLLESIQGELLAISSLDGERADTQVTHCAVSSRLWDVRSLIAQEMGNDDEARKCARESRDFSIQQTRAKAGRVDDKLNDLDLRVTKVATGGRKLHAVGS